MASYTHPTKTTADFHEDYRDCAQDTDQWGAKQAMGDNPTPTHVEILREQSRCLTEKHGWRLTK